MGRKRVPLFKKSVDLHIRIPKILNDEFNDYMLKNKSLTKTEVICNSLNYYLKKLY